MRSSESTGIINQPSRSKAVWACVSTQISWNVLRTWRPDGMCSGGGVQSGLVPFSYVTIESGTEAAAAAEFAAAAQAKH